MTVAGGTPRIRIVSLQSGGARGRATTEAGNPSAPVTLGDTVR